MTFNNYKDLILITTTKKILNGNYKVDDELKKIARKYIKRKRLTRIEMEYLVSFVYSKNNQIKITEILQNYE